MNDPKINEAGNNSEDDEMIDVETISNPEVENPEGVGGVAVVIEGNVEGADAEKVNEAAAKTKEEDKMNDAKKANMDESVVSNEKENETKRDHGNEEKKGTTIPGDTSNDADKEDKEVDGKLPFMRKYANPKPKRSGPKNPLIYSGGRLGYAKPTATPAKANVTGAGGKGNKDNLDADSGQPMPTGETEVVSSREDDIQCLCAPEEYRWKPMTDKRVAVQVRDVGVSCGPTSLHAPPPAVASTSAMAMAKAAATNRVDKAKADQETTNEPGVFVVEKILEKRTVKGRLLYKIRWKGYTKDDDSWEPLEHLDCAQRIEDFERRQKSAVRRKRQMYNFDRKTLVPNSKSTSTQAKKQKTGSTGRVTRAQTKATLETCRERRTEQAMGQFLQLYFRNNRAPQEPQPQPPMDVKDDKGGDDGPPPDKKIKEEGEVSSSDEDVGGPEEENKGEAHKDEANPA